MRNYVFFLLDSDEVLRVKIQRLYDLFQINDIDDIINVIPIESIEKVGDGEASSITKKSTKYSSKTTENGSGTGAGTGAGAGTGTGAGTASGYEIKSPDSSKDDTYAKAEEEIIKKTETLGGEGGGADAGQYLIIIL